MIVSAGGNEKYRDLSFSNDLHEMALGIEYHFFKYNLDKTGHAIVTGRMNISSADGPATADHQAYDVTTQCGQEIV